VPSDPFLAVGAVALGLVVGSYLNVVIHRLPRGESTVRPPSRCPACGARIRPLENVPVIAWLALRGRCSRCGERISWRYPLVEAATGGLFLACLLRFGPTPRAAISALFCCLLVVLALIDLEHLLLPDRLTLPGVALGLAAQPWLPTSFLDAVLGALVGAGGLILVINVWYWLRDEEGMGLGDVNLLAMVGAFLGWQGAAVTLLLGAFSGALVGLALMAAGRVRMTSKLPFGTFLALGGVAALFFGEALVAAYSRFL
jgi:leader peptidase (prepilin peptidase)/N-methyltransferase